MFDNLYNIFLESDKSDHILLGRILNQVFEEIPDRYDEFVKLTNIPNNRALKFRKYADNYYSLPFDVQMSLDSLGGNLRYAVISPTTDESLRQEIIKGDIKSYDEFLIRKNKLKSRRSSKPRNEFQEKTLADRIMKLSPDFLARLLRDIYDKFGTTSKHTHEIISAKYDTTEYPHREIDTIINVVGYTAIKRFYDSWYV